VLLDEDVPQPVMASEKKKSKVLRDLPRSPNQIRGSGETRARTNPEGAAIHQLLLVAPTVIFVLCPALPDSVAGAKLQPQPLGNPEHANDSEALNPFCGATETISEPDEPCDNARVLLERLSP
jgi:hypothetical protein